MQNNEKKINKRVSSLPISNDICFNEEYFNKIINSNAINKLRLENFKNNNNNNNIINSSNNVNNNINNNVINNYIDSNNNNNNNNNIQFNNFLDNNNNIQSNNFIDDNINNNNIQIKYINDNDNNDSKYTKNFIDDNSHYNDNDNNQINNYTDSINNYNNDNIENDKYYNYDENINDSNLYESRNSSKWLTNDIINENYDEIDCIEEAKFNINDSDVSIDIEDINEVINKINYYIEKNEVKDNNFIHSNYLSSNNNAIEELERLTYELKSIDNEESQINLNYNRFNMDTLDYKRGYVNNINRIEKKELPKDNVINSLSYELNYEYNNNDELIYQNAQNSANNNYNQNNENNEHNSMNDLSKSWLNKSGKNENSKMRVVEENNNILSCADRANQALLSMLSDDVKKLFNQDFKELLSSSSDISSEYSYDSTHDTNNKLSSQNLTNNNYSNMNSNQSFNYSKKG